MQKLPKFTLSIALASILFSSANAANEKALELINFKDRSLSTGSGVVVGVFDSVFNFDDSKDNPLLLGKLAGAINNNMIDYKFSLTNEKDTYLHGTQVSSIIASSLGIAPGAKIYGLGYLNSDPIYNFNRDPQIIENDVRKMMASGVKVINHSYASDDYYPLTNLWWDANNKAGYNTILTSKKPLESLSMEDFDNLYKISENLGKGLKDAKTLADLTKKLGILNVIATGNDGNISPLSNSILPSLDESYRGSLAVGALNQDNITITKAADKTTIKINAISEADRKKEVDEFNARYQNSNLTQDSIIALQGKRAEYLLSTLIKKQGVAYFTNFFKGASLYSLMAPGINLDTANGRYGIEYGIYPDRVLDTQQIISGSGTSFAAPFVSGAAAIVADKFKFLSGAQVADVILTTANKNVELPKLAVMANPGNLYNLSIIYFDSNQIPTKNSGTQGTDKQAIGAANGTYLDIDKIKQDLASVGFKLDKSENGNSQSENGLADLIISRLTTDKSGNVAVFHLSKEEAIGAGILDIANALNGLSAINVNRLNPSDVKSFTTADGKSEKYAFYTINTKGFSGTFTNDIEEIKWDDKYHVDGALNSLKGQNPQNLKAGFIKDGEGTLTFANNAIKYEGPTISQGGILNLHNAVFEKSALYAQNSGTIQISGDRSDAKAHIYAQNGGEVLILGTLLGGNVESLKGGRVSGVGTIKQNLINKAGFVIPGGANSIGVLNVGEKYTQEVDGTLQINFNGAANSDLIAKTYEIKGGKLVYNPLLGTFFENKQEISIDFNSLDKDNNLDKLEISLNDTKTLEFSLKENDKKTIVVGVKENAYKVPSGDGQSSATQAAISKGIAEIRGNDNLSENYKNIFGLLDTAPDELRNRILNSIANSTQKPLQTNIKSNINFQNRANLNNLSFLSATKVANAGTNGVKVASIGSDLPQATIASPYTTEIYSKIGYSKLNGDGYDANGLFLDLGAKKWVSDSVKVGAFLNYSYQNGDYELSDVDTNIISGGLMAIKDFDIFSLSGGLSGGVAFNEMQRSVVGSSETLSADYNSYFTTAEVGILKGFNVAQNWQLTPIASLSYSYLKQDDFRESGGAFAKGYKSLDLDSWNLSLGGNVAYSYINSSDIATTISGFAFYTRRLSGDSFTTQEYFLDSRNTMWATNYELGKDSVYFGIDSVFEKNGKFLEIMLSSEIFKDEYSLNAGLKAGIRF